MLDNGKHMKSPQPNVWIRHMIWPSLVESLDPPLQVDRPNYKVIGMAVNCKREACRSIYRQVSCEWLQDKRAR